MWEMFAEEKITEEGVSYTAFGIRKNDFSIADISTDRREAEELVSLFNRYDASEINAADIVEDYLAAL